MQYYIDGYNLLFFLKNSQEELEIQREDLIAKIRQRADGLDILIIFDSKVDPKELQRSHLDDLEIAYTSSDQTADCYIIERIRHAKYPKTITVVTNDRKLSDESKALGAKVMAPAKFISWINKRKLKKERQENEPEMDQNSYEYYLKTFEEKYKKNNQ